MSDRFDKYEYLTGEEILSSDQSRIIEQTKITYYPLGKAFGKQIKTIEDQGIYLFIYLLLSLELTK